MFIFWCKWKLWKVLSKLTDLYHALIIFFRIWSHGLQSHQRKSALWHYLYKFGRTNEKLLRFKGTLGVQAYCIPLINSKPYILPDHSRPIQVVIDPKVRKNSFVRVHPMFSRILKFLFVIGYFEKKQARKGFPWMCDVCNYFFVIFLEDFFWGYFLRIFFWRNFLVEFFGRNFFGGFFWENFFGRIFRSIFW